MTAARRRISRAFTPGEWRRLGALSGTVALLHVLGFGLLVLAARAHPVLIGLGTLAYTFGLRHAFDADHIAAIDNATRRLLERDDDRKDGRALGAGLFFSLGHSTVVLVLLASLAVAAGAVHASLPALSDVGGSVGAVVSGTFLWAIGTVNLLVLLDIARLARGLRQGRFDEAELDARLLDRGLINRSFVGRLFHLVRRSWHLYPLGLLFGLGLDTAGEVALLALSAGAATGQVPVLGALALPLLFAAGMSLMDTADGVFVAKAYGWAFASPVRKLYYNLAVTGLSVAVALGVGTIELLQAAADRLGLGWAWLDALNLQVLGFAIAGLFALTWLVAVVVWRARGIERRWSAALDGRAEA
jgi:high-affinity nickel-transport protein